MSKLYTSMLVLAALQPLAGTAVALDGTKAILCGGVAPRPAVITTEERNNVKAYFGHSGSVTTSKYSEVDIEVEFAPSGAKGVAPKYGHLLRACALSETITMGTSVVYAPVTSGTTEMLTLEVWIDGIRHRMTDAKGTVSWEVKSKSICKLKFKFTGLYVKAADAPMPTGVDYSDFIDPIPVNADNTPSWSLHGQTGVLESISFDLANKVVHSDRPGGESIKITGRAPIGNALFEMGDIADQDWFETAIKAELGTLTVVHGKTDGNIIEISSPKVQLSEPAYSDSDGTLMIGLKCIYKPNLGNDELIITLK